MINYKRLFCLLTYFITIVYSFYLFFTGDIIKATYFISVLALAEVLHISCKTKE